MMMIQTLAVTWLCLGSSALAFTTAPQSQTARQSLRSTYPLYSTATQDLLLTAEKLKDKHGVFILDKAAKQELEEAVCALEKQASSSSITGDYTEKFLGDWKLLCTCSSNLERPDFIPENPLRTALTKNSNKYVTVTQRIRSVNSDGNNKVDRVDNVIVYKSPQQVGNLLDNLPEQLANLDVFNPLEISDTKVILAHDAKVIETYGDSSLFTTEIALSSIILNVAGQSTVLDPQGKDVLSLNVPAFASEFGQSGTFETTYLDDEVRISRGSVLNGVVDQLRVFVRTSPSYKQNVAEPVAEEPFVEEAMGKGKVVGDDVEEKPVVSEDKKEDEKEADDVEDPGVGGSDDYDLTPSA